MMPLKLKVAVVPVKLVVDMTVPFNSRDREVIPVGRVPVALRVKLLKVTLFPPGLLN
jgi:hypothetical protein